ncbi:protein disulfide-isomerase domain protein [Trichuris suis]|nr:protein disulfide-isomerase domain protein [Trichuris suis]
MMFLETLILVLIVTLSTSTLYSGNNDVVELTASNFQSKVIDSDAVWIVEFYAPWCGHCQNFAPEFAKAAKALKGIVKVGGVDMDKHGSVGGPYNVQGFPTVKIFGIDKNKPTDFQGGRTAQALADAAINEVKRLVQMRLTGRRPGADSKKSSSTGSAKDVIELTDSNFEDMITNSDDMWLVEFFAPWCGHCKNLAPHWQSAATQLKGRVKVAAIDATVNTVMAQRFGIQGFPTIKMFPSGAKSLDDAVEYTGGRSASDIVQWAEEKLAESAPPPEIEELINQKRLTDCGDHQLCIISVLPHILDCQSKCRNEYIDMLRQAGERFKKNRWGWLWVEGAAQPSLEEALGLGGFGYPAMAAVNTRKMKFSTLRGSFGKEGITEFLRELSYGRGSTSPMKGTELPKIVTVEPWDGKDGEYPKEEDIDLSDVVLDKQEL